MTIIDVVLWLPINVLKRVLRPVTTTLSSLSELDEKALNDYIKENTH